MRTTHRTGSALGIVAALTLGACASTGSPPYTSDSGSYNQPYNQPYNSQSYNQERSYGSYGVVQSMELVRQDSGGGVGIGTIAGAVVGGVVGNQVGSGRGNTAATVLGAAGGAYIGHEMENRRQQVDAYRISIRMEDGSRQTLMQGTHTDLRVGDRVQIVNGIAQRY